MDAFRDALLAVDFEWRWGVLYAQGGHNSDDHL